MDQLDNFIKATLQEYPTLWDEYDPDWRSPCETGEPIQFQDTQVIPWRPLKRHGADDFSGLERAFETPIHHSIKEYFGAYWSGGLEAESVHGHVSLILLWNIADRDRMLENQIGHALAQKKGKIPLSLFFACTEPGSELFLTINNSNGRVQLERPGYDPLRTVSSNIGEFLDQLEPAPPHRHPERRGLRGLFEAKY